MTAKHLTMRGDPIDMHALMSRHATTTAIGNARMNARGDILGQGGLVLKTQEQVNEEWRRAQAQQDASVGIDPNIKAPMPAGMTTVQQPKKVLADDRDFDPNAADVAPVAPPTIIDNRGQQPKRRKIVETD